MKGGRWSTPFASMIASSRTAASSVQTRASAAAEPVKRLARRLLREALAALFIILGVTLALWVFVVQMLRSPATRAGRDVPALLDDSTVHSRETIELPFPERR